MIVRFWCYDVLTGGYDVNYFGGNELDNSGQYVTNTGQQCEAGFGEFLMIVCRNISNDFIAC